MEDTLSNGGTLEEIAEFESVPEQSDDAPKSDALRRLADDWKRQEHEMWKRSPMWDVASYLPWYFTV